MPGHNQPSVIGLEDLHASPVPPASPSARDLGASVRRLPRSASEPTRETPIWEGLYPMATGRSWENYPNGEGARMQPRVNGNPKNEVAALIRLLRLDGAAPGPRRRSLRPPRRS